MQQDYFESSTLSSVISWVIAIPIFISIIGMFIQTLFGKSEGTPKIFIIWLLLCFIIFSPIRYLFFQVLLASSYGVQSWSAFFSLFPLAIYLPIVYYILYFLGFVIPLIICIKIAGSSEKFNTFRMILASLAAPIICSLTTYLFLIVLPYAAYSTHWLKAENVIKASNGPAWYYYKYVGSHFYPFHVPNYIEQVGNNNDKAYYRSHIASLYLSDKQHSKFIKYEYPAYYASMVEKPNKVKSLNVLGEEVDITEYIHSKKYKLVDASQSHVVNFINTEPYEITKEDELIIQEGLIEFIKNNNLSENLTDLKQLYKKANYSYSTIMHKTPVDVYETELALNKGKLKVEFTFDWMYFNKVTERNKIIVLNEE
jgi:hypothetical protein